MKRLITGASLLACACVSLLAQRGDKGQTNQPLRVAREKIPPAPALSPDQAVRSFKLPRGFRIALVASEPLIEAPVAISFDAEGRLWVLEMRGFMPNVDGKGEWGTPSRVVLLEDTDQDGRIDKRTIFLDNLTMPRAIAAVLDGVLIADPPKLWFCRDTDGDGKCDQKIEVAGDYGDPKNPEHTANGLVWNIDNRIYSHYHPFRYRFSHGKWSRDSDITRAQWGLTHDDFGRLFYTSNGDHLRGDLVPAQYLKGRMPGTKLSGIGFKIAADQTVWPGRVNPGVNRGYEPNTLRGDGTLLKFTAACGTSIYRGDLFPADFYGNAFVCEPGANVVRRDILTEKDGVISAANAYASGEFLTSTDERFRPVNTCTGPDGALYIVDMYRGIIQHRLYVTTYLRNQILERGLEKPLDKGRIYRVVPEGKPAMHRPSLAKATASELVQALSDANGWRRDTAQRLLVERRASRADGSLTPSIPTNLPPKADAHGTVSPLTLPIESGLRGEGEEVPELKRLLQTSPIAVARLHALWTLEGLEQVEPETVLIGLADKEPKIRAAAIRIAEVFLKNGSNSAASVRSKVFALATDPAAEVQTQLALSLGQLAPDGSARQVLSNLLARTLSVLARDAAAFALKGYEPPKATVAVSKKPLSPADQKQFEAGKTIYEMACLACHQQHGLGQEGLAPPLVESEWVASSPERLVRIVLNGLHGPIHVKQQLFELDMPSLGVLDDEQIANVLTYVRHEWGHVFSSVDPATVKRIREATAQREEAWTETDLLKVR